MEIEARKLLQHPTEELASILTGRFIVSFDNGEKLETNAVETIYSSFVWDILRRYSKAPILPQHHIRFHLRKKYFNSKTTINMYTEHFRTIIQYYKDDPNFSRNSLMHLIYQVNNNLYNHIIKIVAPWRVSLDILDFIKVTDNKEIQEIRKNMVVSPNGVDEAQKAIIKVLKTSHDLDDSVLAQGVRVGIMSEGQVVKCVGNIGYVTDVDNYIFKRPVLRNYTEGIRLFHDSLIESRSGAKSLQFSKKQLQDTEYFSRRLQLNTMNVQNIHYGDCGTKKYILWYVKPDVYDEDGKLESKGDLPLLVGRYYFDDEGNLKVITEKDTHLIGTQIKMRTVRYCNHPDPYGVCSTCFGDLAFSVPENANIGHLCSVNMISPISQAVLSVKHLDGSAKVEGVFIAPVDEIFLKPGSGGNSYKLNKACLKMQPKLIVSAKDGKMLSHVNDVDDVDELPIGRITSLETITIQHLVRPPLRNEDTKIIEIVNTTIPVSIKRRMGSFTHEFLAYIQKKGWTYNNKRDFVIDLSDWDFSQLFIDLPLKHHSMADHAKEVANLIESNMVRHKSDKAAKGKKRAYGEMLAQLFELVNSKANLNISILDVVLYATCIVSENNHNYALPKGFTTGEFSVRDLSMRYRSISAAMLYQGHLSILSDALNYLVTNRPDHPFDALIVPELMQ